ncbi:MAG: heavy metal-associated domain-containing protein, partial [Planctomycetota bacterium]
MRYTSLITLTIAAALLAGCASTLHGDATDRYSLTPIASDNATLRVNGMSCPKCANSIERQLASLAGVESVAIDLGAGTVAVGFGAGVPHPSEAQLATAIDNTGFT